MKFVILLSLALLSRLLSAETAGSKPNIILVLFVDMGYGQPQCYNAKSALRTPNLDKFAKQGTGFNDALTVAIPAAALGQGVRVLKLTPKS
jgi:hypothetical protein